MADDHSVLFDAFELNSDELRNRVGLAPMTRVSATEDGRATERMEQYYRKFANGGFGFLLTEGVYPDEAYSQGYFNQPGLANDEHAAAWEKVTESVHDAGTPIFAQLMHAGAISQGNEYEDERIGPSAVEPKGEQLGMYGGNGQFDTPRKMTDENIEDAIRSFVDAADRAQQAGFDGVEIHGANGYLLDQFLTGYTNERDDEYGGSTENRVGFPVEVVEAVQEATPEEFVVGIRISQSKVNDPDYRWSGGESDAEVVFGELSAAGVDYLHVTEEDVLTPAFDSGPTLSELAAKYGDVPVISNGGLGDPERATESVESNGADLITLAKGALATPNWPERVTAGRELDDFDFEAILQPNASIGQNELPN